MGACFCTGACCVTGRCGVVPFATNQWPMPDPFVLTTETPFRNLTHDPATPAPQDDAQSPAPSPLAGAWQCPGCGTIYSFMVNKCECQKRKMVSRASSTIYFTDGTFTSEMG